MRESGLLQNQKENAAKTKTKNRAKLDGLYQGYPEVSGTLLQTWFMDYKKEFHEICNYLNSREIYFQCD